MTDYGLDVSTFTGAAQDLDPNFGIISGVHVVAEAVARRLSTPRGALWYDQNYGFDLRSLLNIALSTSQLGLYAAQIEAECRKDERVQAASVQLIPNSVTSSMRVAIALTTASGPFTLDLNVTALTISLLSH